jgi:ATP-dependent RNA helicase SrmB
MQVADHARELAAHTHLDIATITGGVAYMNHAEVFSEPGYRGRDHRPPAAIY